MDTPFKLEQLTEPLLLGEGPHWDERSQTLYFVDILNKTINKYDVLGNHTSTKVDGRPGFIVPVENTTDQFLLGLELRLVVVQWDGKQDSPAKLLRVMGEVEQGSKNRINDGKADPRGRIYFGTMGYEEPLGNIAKDAGSFYRLDGTKVTKLAEKIGISNGLAWDEKAKAFYYIDSMERKIRRYDYDIETGEISNLKYVFDLAKHDMEGCFPDGMTVDRDGNLWVAIFNGSAVFKIDPRTGEVLRKVPIPAKQVTSLAFGGPFKDILFVTTASMPIDGVQQPAPCGALFMVTGTEVEAPASVSYKP